MHHHHSLELKNRTLWFDGSTSMTPDNIAEILLNGGSMVGIHPIEVDSDVKKYNQFSGEQLVLKTDINIPEAVYDIPEHYLNIDLRKYAIDKLEAIVADSAMSQEDIFVRIKRIRQELKLIDQYGIQNLFKTAIYIVEEFVSNDIVWGTGRGSSCACYILYLIGLHEVDSVQYNLDLSEFFR